MFAPRFRVVTSSSSSSAPIIISLSAAHLSSCHRFQSNNNNNNTLDDELLSSNSTKTTTNNNNKINPSPAIRPPLPASSQSKAKHQMSPPTTSAGGIVRPKLMMMKKPATILPNSKIITSNPAPPGDKNTAAGIPKKNIVQLKSINPTSPSPPSSISNIAKPAASKTETGGGKIIINKLSTTSSPSSSSRGDNSPTATTAAKVTKTVTTSLDAQTILEDDETDLEIAAEACELIVPSQGGLSISELFATLDAEDRMVIKKSKFKMLAKFLQNYPERFALSPSKTFVCLVAGCGGDRNLAEHYAKVTEELNATLEEFVSGALSSSTSNNTAKSKKAASDDDDDQEGSSFISEMRMNDHGRKSFLSPPSAEDIEKLNHFCNPFFLEDYTPITAADEAARIERSVCGVGEHHKIVIDSVPPPDLVNLSTIQAIGDRIRTPAHFKNSVQDIFENVLSTQTLVKFVPTWFVPAKEVVEMMGEGYTEEHFEQFFGDSTAVEMVTLQDQKFVRLHGGNKHKCLVDFDCPEAREAEALFQHYKPDPSIVVEVLKVCPPRGQWVPLYEVWRRLPVEVQKRFPFEGPLSLTYFAQMQHVFSFSPNDGGGICVPLGLPGHLHWDSTPFVKQVHAVFGGLLNGKRAYVGDLLNQFFPVSSPSRRPLREPFLRGLLLARAIHSGGTMTPEYAFTCDVEALDNQQVEDLMRVFISLHQNVFAYKEESILSQLHNGSGKETNDNASAAENITPDTIQTKIGRTVLLRFEFEAEERHNLDIPAQIEIAQQRGNNKTVRKLKRKLMILQQPDNPLLDEENLAKAIAEFLPPDRSIAWPRLKKNLPLEILDLVPADRKRFFLKWGQYFKKFDVGVLHNHNIHLQHPHLTPPPGAFRGPGEYTSEELLSAMGQVLLRGPKNVAALCSALPDGIHDSLRLMFGGVAQAVQQHPQFFALVLKDVRNKDLRSAVVTLVQVPNLLGVENNLVESERAADENRTMLTELTKEYEKGSTGFETQRGGQKEEEDDNVWEKVIDETIPLEQRKGVSSQESFNQQSPADPNDPWTNYDHAPKGEELGEEGKSSRKIEVNSSTVDHWLS